MILNRVFCDLQDGLHISHMGRGQQSEDSTEYRWLTWDERGTRRAEQSSVLRSCIGTRSHRAVVPLPVGHPGAHHHGLHDRRRCTPTDYDLYGDGSVQDA